MSNNTGLYSCGGHLSTAYLHNCLAFPPFRYFVRKAFRLFRSYHQSAQSILLKPVFFSGNDCNYPETGVYYLLNLFPGGIL